MATSSSAIRSSISKSPSASTISVRRASPYFSWVSLSSLTTISINNVSLARIARRRSMVFINPANSSTIFCRSNPVNRWSCISRIAWAWSFVRENCTSRPLRASVGFVESLINLITASKWSSAIFSPSRIWARASAFRRSCSVRRRTTSRLNSIKCSTTSSSVSTCGRPATIASVMMPKDVCSCVCLKRLFRTTAGTSPRLSSMTIRMPDRSDSSRKSAIPSIVFSRASSAIFSSSRALLIWYGISVTTIASLSLFLSDVSISVLARITIEPRPVRYACAIPARPTIKPPVGKSGPGTRPKSSFSFTATSSVECSATHTMPSITSRRLCGGIFVAIPTAIPAEPFTSKFGKGAGNTDGSSLVSS